MPAQRSQQNFPGQGSQEYAQNPEKLPQQSFQGGKGGYHRGGGHQNYGYHTNTFYRDSREYNRESEKGGNIADYQSVHYFFDLYSKGFDNLYREPKDGMISLRKNHGEPQPPQDQSKYAQGVPEIELITLIDLSTLWEDKQNLASIIAEQLCTLNHPNLLNITRQLRYLDNQTPKGFLQFASEAPDHISSWKSFCKRPFDLAQILSIFR